MLSSTCTRLITRIHTHTHTYAVAELKAEAARIEHETELQCQTQAREAEINFIREQNELEVSKAKELSVIEVIRWSFEGWEEMFDYDTTVVMLMS